MHSGRPLAAQSRADECFAGALKWLIVDFLSLTYLVAGVLCISVVLLDSFETIILPRTVKRRVRLTGLFFYLSKVVYHTVGRLRDSGGKQTLLVSFAPLTMILLIGTWAVLLITGFALLGMGLHLPLQGAATPGIGNREYYSGSTFFTLGYGDLTPTSGAGKAFAVLEAGMGLGFLALIISYIPVLYQAFSRREVTILLLDSKAGSNPMAGEMLRRHAEACCMEQLTTLLKDWEVFSAQLLESYLSYPILAYYRSQHDDQSWLESLGAVVDACALISGGFLADQPWEKPLKFQAKATFAMARHVIVDLAYVLDAEPHHAANRLSKEKLQAIRLEMAHIGFPLDPTPEAEERIRKSRELYEPYLVGLSNKLQMALPEWMPDGKALDNWQTSAWDGMHF